MDPESPGTWRSAWETSEKGAQKKPVNRGRKIRRGACGGGGHPDGQVLAMAMRGHTYQALATGLALPSASPARGMMLPSITWFAGGGARPIPVDSSS